ncbi:MAG: 50S ribosomal protein L4 [Acidimicrobiia bacterium]|jgi:large subunit ribosomal protein L4
MSELRAPLYSSSGVAKGEVPLDPLVFGIEPNMAVMHQVVTAQLAAARSGTASTKTRAEVRGGGRKPWRQKGLGRARHGSIRAPQWVGGGVAHGPKPRDYAQRTPKKMKRLALVGALSARASENAVSVVERLDWAAPKTKQAVVLLQKIGASKKAVVVVTPSDVVAMRSFRNLPEVLVVEPGQLTAYDVLWSDDVIFTVDTVDAIAGHGGYEVSTDDFVKEEAEPSGPAAPAEPPAGGEEE